MYRLILILIAALTLLPIGTTHAQTRDFGAYRVWLDDHNGHRLLLRFLGPTDGVVTFPSGASTTIGIGDSPFQTLRWNGSAWVPASNLLNDDTNITLTGQLISLVPDGTPPFLLVSQTVIPNLNADLFDGFHAEDFVQDSLAINTAPPLTGGGFLMDDLTLGLAHDPTLRVSEGLLGVNLSNSNAWLATQTLPITDSQGSNLISAINAASSSTIDAARLDATVITEGDIGSGLGVTSGVLSNSGVLSVTGTTNEIIATPTTGHVIVSLPETIDANITGNAATATWAATAHYADTAGTAGGVSNTTQTGNSIIQAINIADSNIAPWALDPSVLLQTEVIGTTNEIDVNEAGGILTLSLPPTINADLNGNAVTADYADSAGVANRVTINNETGNTIINAINIADSVIAPWALDPSVLLQTEVIGTTNEIDVNEAGGILTLSLPPTINADLNGNALTADYADSAGKAGSIAVTQEMGNTIINAINMADSNIHYWALDETILLQTEVVGTTNEIDVTISGNNVVLSLPTTVNANINGNATTATTALSTNYADTAGVANLVANTSAAGGSIIDALTTNGDTLTNSIFGTSSNVTGVVIEMNGGTGISSYTKGDMLYADTTNSLATLPIGSENQVLYVNSGRPQWGSVPAAGSTPYAIYPTVVDVDSSITFTVDSAIVSSSTVIFLSASVTTNPQILLPNGTTSGQLLIIMSYEGSDHFHIHDTGNINVPNPNQFSFQEHGDNITLLWCGTMWIEVARTDIN